MNYSDRLDALKLKKDVNLSDIGDQWRTPDKIFKNIEKLVLGVNSEFVLDLFTDGDNSKCVNFFTNRENALLQNWTEKLNSINSKKIKWGFANPPYSREEYQNGLLVTGMYGIMQKAMAERDKGGNFLFIVKNAHSERWWPDGFGKIKADAIITIKGRISFGVPGWAKSIDSTSSGFGSSLIIFSKNYDGKQNPIDVRWLSTN